MRPALVSILLILAGCSKPQSTPVIQETPEPAESLEDQKRAISEAAANYVPKVQGQISQLNAPAAEILRQLPGVAKVEVLVASPAPAHRIIHIRDWHYVPKDLFAIDIRQAAGRNLSDEEVAASYRSFLEAHELVQMEQAGALRALITHHGLKRVLMEGLTPDRLEVYQEVLALMGKTYEQIKSLKKLRSTVEGPVPEIDAKIAEMEKDVSRRLLEYGASGLLVVTDKLDVHPLDDEELLEGQSP